MDMSHFTFNRVDIDQLKLNNEKTTWIIMVWQENLFQNLLSLTIILILGLTVYCKVTGKTLTELIIGIREAMSVPIENE